MYNFRYYAIGHSYLKHGPFVGWQTDGFWGMAASAPENDYFHKFIDELKGAFDCEVEAIAENQSVYECLCTEDATEEKYTSSEYYAHMRDLILGFKPNIITVFVGGGNTPAKDEVSLARFYEVIFELVAKCKRPETVVVCPALKPYLYNISKPIADKYGFITVDYSFIHEIKGRDNPYYAYNEYPEYDELRAKGAIEFRTHPNDKGHAAIAKLIFDGAREDIKKIPEGELTEGYEYDKFINRALPAKMKIETEPEMAVSYFGFNIHQNGDCVEFCSAAGTGAAFSATDFSVSGATSLALELCVDGYAEGDALKIKLTGAQGAREYELPIVSGMHSYELDLPSDAGEITSLYVTPSSEECVINAKRIVFYKTA